jgi:hypothetical protein
MAVGFVAPAGCGGLDMLPEDGRDFIGRPRFGARLGSPSSPGEPACWASWKDSGERLRFMPRVLGFSSSELRAAGLMVAGLMVAPSAPLGWVEYIRANGR